MYFWYRQCSYSSAEIITKHDYAAETNETTNNLFVTTTTTRLCCVVEV